MWHLIKISSNSKNFFNSHSEFFTLIDMSFNLQNDLNNKKNLKQLHPYNHRCFIYCTLMSWSCYSRLLFPDFYSPINSTTSLIYTFTFIYILIDRQCILTPAPALFTETTSPHSLFFQARRRPFFFLFLSFQNWRT